MATLPVQRPDTESVTSTAFVASTVGHRQADALPIPSASQSQALIAQLEVLLGPSGVLTNPADLAAYECDGYTVEKNKPTVVVFPTTAEQVAAIVKLCNQLDVPFMARGAGTSLAGGCVPVGGGVMIATSRLKKIIEVNIRDRYAWVEAGVVNV